MAQACLGIALRSNPSIDEGIVTKIPLTQYAAKLLGEGVFKLSHLRAGSTISWTHISLRGCGQVLRLGSLE